MKLWNKIRKPRGLRAKFGLSIFWAAILSAAVFSILYFGMSALLLRYFDERDFEDSKRAELAEELQEYLNEEGIGFENIDQLEKWDKKQPTMMLEIYDGQNCIFSSIHQYKHSRTRWNSEWEHEVIMDPAYSYNLELEGEPVTAVVYAEFTYKYYVAGTAVAIGVALLLFASLFVYSTGQLISYIIRLRKEVEILEGGNLEYQVTEEGNDELTELAHSMNLMRKSLLEQQKKEQELQTANRQLITEMSHDLRTPLTGLMLYTEILRSHHYEKEEDIEEYLKKIDQKAHHLKHLSDHLFEYAQDGKKSDRREKISFRDIFREPVENMISELKTRSFQVETELEWQTLPIVAGRDAANRILENIGSNIVKYARKDVPVRVETVYNNNYCGLIFMNTIAEDKIGVESSGVGMESVQTLVKELDGICRVEETESVFEISVMFPVHYGTV